MNPRLFEVPLEVPPERPPEVHYRTLEQLVAEAGFRTFPDWLRPGPIHTRTQHQLQAFMDWVAYREWEAWRDWVEQRTNTRHPPTPIPPFTPAGRRLVRGWNSRKSHTWFKYKGPYADGGEP